jgi:hypothetical protein
MWKRADVSVPVGSSPCTVPGGVLVSGWFSLVPIQRSPRTPMGNAMSRQ